MKRIIKNLLFVFILITALVFIDSNAYLSEVKAGESPVPSDIKVEKISDTSTKLTWSKTEGVSSYEIYLKNGDVYSHLTSINDSNATSWVHENLPQNEEYTYVIKTRNNIGSESDFSYWVSIFLGDQNSTYTNLESISFVNAPVSLEINKTINLSLNITKENVGLELINNSLRWSTSDSTIATVDENGILKTFKPGMVTVSVRGHNGKKTAFSVNIIEKSNNDKNINQQKPVNKNISISAPFDIKATRKSSKTVKLEWKKVDSVAKYEVYRKKKGKYIKIATVNHNYYTDKHLKKNKEYYYRIKSVKVVSGKTYISNFSHYVSCYTYSKNNKYTNLKSIKFYANAKKLTEGNKLQLLYVKFKQKSNKKLKNKELKWWSSDPRIATVNGKGKVTAKSYGKVTIYVRGHNGVTAHHKLIIDSKYAVQIPILTFHRIVTNEDKINKYPLDQWTASVDDFEEQMKYLYDNGYKTISAEEFENWYYGKVKYPKKTVMLTFDDGDYEIYYLVLPILKKYNFKATDFIIGSYTSDFTMSFKPEGRYRIGKDLINRISYEYPNLKFESHTYNLHYRDNYLNPIVYSKTYEEIMEDFSHNKNFGFNYIAYPYGATTHDFLKATEDSGMRLGFEFGEKGYRCATREDYKFKIPRVKINGQITYKQYVKKLNSCVK